jgi:glycosyltransferase involved in cell wall biosynthesis
MLSVIIIAKNEAHNIERCLKSLSFAQEIIVLDSGSQDKTVEIAKQYTSKVFETDWQGYGVQKQRALMLATCPWVLNLDADEVIDDALKSEILQAIHQNEIDAFRVPIQMCFYGKPLRFSWSPQRHLRLFKRDGARFSDDLVHEKIILPNHARVSKLKSPIWHYSFKDLSHAIEKLNRYSSYSAKERVRFNKKTSFLGAIFSSVWMFIRCYILQGGILDGRAGYIFAVMSAQGAFYRRLKVLYPDIT